MRKTLVLTILLAVLWPARPAHASCYDDPGPLRERLAQAPVAFVGTVQSTTNRDRFAIIAVEEVWRGSSLPDLVEVHGTSLDNEFAMTSNDRSFTVGVRYLIVPTSAAEAGNVFYDNQCSATREYSPELDELRPLDDAPEAADEPAEAPEPETAPRTRRAAPVAPAPRVEHFVGQGEPIAEPVDAQRADQSDPIALASAETAPDDSGLSTMPVVIAAFALLAVGVLVARRLFAPASS